jgi:hypothetical protein
MNSTNNEAIVHFSLTFCYILRGKSKYSQYTALNYFQFMIFPWGDRLSFSHIQNTM